MKDLQYFFLSLFIYNQMTSFGNIPFPLIHVVIHLYNFLLRPHNIISPDIILMSHTITFFHNAVWSKPKNGYKKTTRAKVYSPYPMWFIFLFPHRHNPNSACTYDCSQVQTLPIVVPIQFGKLSVEHSSTSFTCFLIEYSCLKKMSRKFF